MVLHLDESLGLIHFEASFICKRFLQRGVSLNLSDQLNGQINGSHFRNSKPLSELVYTFQNFFDFLLPHGHFWLIEAHSIGTLVGFEPQTVESASPTLPSDCNGEFRHWWISWKSSKEGDCKESVSQMKRAKSDWNCLRCCLSYTKAKNAHALKWSILFHSLFSAKVFFIKGRKRTLNLI